MRRHPVQVRHPVTKRDEQFVNPRWWTPSGDERRYMAERDLLRAPARQERPMWPFVLLAVSLALVLAIDAAPQLRGILADIPWAKLFNYQPVSPIDPGDRNGLLHK
jgi:hypothetical protein